MTRVPCPHCGFMNFSISAYCGRCERPLPRAGDASTTVPTPIVLGAVPSGSSDTPTVVDVPAKPTLTRPTPLVAPRPAPSAPRVRFAVPGIPTPIAVASAMSETAVPVAPVGRGAASALASVPPPLPPLSLDAPPPAVQPIELEAKAGRRKRPAGPDIGDPHPDPDAEVPVAVPGEWRLLAARLIDALIVVAYGAAVVFLGTLVTGASFSTLSSGTLDTLAEWLNTNRELVRGTLVMTAAFGAGYGVWAAARSGQTLGRKLTNTVLVRRNGKPFTAPVLVLRALASLVSAALLGAGFLWAVVDPYHRTWHDLVAGTVTVRRYVHVPGARAR